jgi:hypothetical protein
MARSSVLSLILLVVICAVATAFVPPCPIRSPPSSSASKSLVVTTTSSLAERKWNFNEGQAPWGLKKNAEIWNGRVAQVRGRNEQEEIIFLGTDNVLFGTVFVILSMSLTFVVSSFFPKKMAFVWVFLQELITGKGIFKGLEEGDAFFIANAVVFAIGVVGLTGFLALQGTDDYTKDS